MYLKAIVELRERGIPSLRARLSERLGHAPATVTDMVQRLAEASLVFIADDRQVCLTRRGFREAVSVLAKHRIIECFLDTTVGLEWSLLHDEACRWEHVVSDEAAYLMQRLLGTPDHDPYGNPIPEPKSADWPHSIELTLEEMVSGRSPHAGLVLGSLGERIQTSIVLLRAFDAAGLRPGARFSVAPYPGGYALTGEGSESMVLLTSTQLRDVGIATRAG